MKKIAPADNEAKIIRLLEAILAELREMNRGTTLEIR